MLPEGLFLIDRVTIDESWVSVETVDGTEFDLHRGQAGFMAAKLTTLR